MRKPRMPLEDASVLAVLTYNPTWTLNKCLKERLFAKIRDARARQIAAVLLEKPTVGEMSEDVRQIVDRILSWKKRHDYLAQQAIKPSLANGANGAS